MKPENSQQRRQDKADVLVALAAQKSEVVEQAPAPEELADFFANPRRFSKQRKEAILAYLDSCPEAYERWIKQGKKAAQQSASQPYAFFGLPYTVAACALLLLMGVVLLWRGQGFELEQAIDRSYQIAAFDDDEESFQQGIASLAEVLQEEERPFSFSQSGPSQSKQAFALGLKHDWQKPEQQIVANDDLINEQWEHYQLGRWYSLLWTVSQQNKIMPPDFWKGQLEILDYFQTYYARYAGYAIKAQETDAVEFSSINLQLERVKEILHNLTENDQTAKFYRQLEQTLNALRYGFMTN